MRQVHCLVVAVAAAAVFSCSAGAVDGGKLDTSFGVGGIGKADNEQYDYGFAAARQNDGKIVVVGRAGSGSTSDFLVARFLVSGHVDTSFGTAGTVRSDFGERETALAVAIQTDGKIIVAGYRGPGFSGPWDFLVARYNANGSLDTSFDTDGFHVVNFGADDDKARGVAIQTDGKIVVVGGTGTSSSWTYNYAVARFDTDGSLDTTFDGDGILETDFSNYASANAVVIQGDGKIVAAGEHAVATKYEFSLARYNTDGTMDTTFSADGRVTTSFHATNYAWGKAVALQSDGKIVVAGQYYDGKYYFAAARYGTNGSIDTTFSGDGMLTTAFGTEDAYGRGVVVDAKGRVVVGGYSDYDFALARYASDGSPDVAFGTSGRLTTDGGDSDYGNGLLLLPDGGLIVAGYASDGIGNDMAVVRYNPSLVDPAFGAHGKTSLDAGSVSDTGRAVALQNDGKVIVAGSIDISGSDRDILLARLEADGNLDTTWDGDGYVHVPVAGQEWANDLAVQTDDKIVVVGATDDGGDDDWAIARVNADGSLDTTFSGDGLVTVDFAGGDDTALAVGVQGDGKIVVAGTANNGTDEDFGVYRFNADGSPDAGFGTSGMKTIDFGGQDNVEDVAIQTDGKIVLAGYSSTGSFALARLNTDGSLDTGFDTDGTLTTDFGGTEHAYAVAVQTDGKIVAGGTVDTGAGNDFALARYDTDGSLDASFDTDGKVVTDIGTDAVLRDLVMRGDRPVAIGFADVGADADFTLVVYTADGAVATTVGDDGMDVQDFAGGLDEAYGAVLQSDGRIIAAGTATSGSDDDLAVARYDMNSAPTATDDAATTDEATALAAIDVLANDSDPDPGTTLVVSAFDDTGTTGTVTLNGDDTFAYDPAGGFESLALGASTTDSFTYTVSDGSSGTATGTVTVTVDGLNDTPAAVDDDSISGWTTDEDTVLTVTPAGVLDNDVDPDAGDTLTVSAFDATSAQGAAVTVNADGTFTYDPTNATALQVLAAAGSVDDTFTYTASDGNGGTATATVTIPVTGLNDAPAAADDTATTYKASVVTTVDVRANDTDAEGDGLTIAAFDATGTNGGLVTDNGDGTFDYDPNGQFDVLTSGQTDTDTFTYTVSDGNGGTDIAMVTVTIDGTPPPSGGGDSGCVPGASSAIWLVYLAAALALSRRHRVG